MKDNFKWAIFGTFDVDNYGDLLFPIVASWRLEGGVIAYSPTNITPSFSRGTNIIYLPVSDSLVNIPSVSLIGGGNILHFRASTVRPYSGRWFSYASLQVIPILLKKYFGVPVCYNSPSLPSIKNANLWRFLFRYFFRNSDFLSFRDFESVKFARTLTNKSVYCTPDTAFDIARIFPRTDSIKPVACSYFVVHVNERYGGEVVDVAMSLDKIKSELGIAIVFLPIGPCHGDIEYAEKVASFMSSQVLIVKELDVNLFAQYIANSEMYLGSSMHGFITALSYGVKASLVLNENPMEKFRGVISDAGFSSDYFFRSWVHASSGMKDIVAIDLVQLSLIHKKLDCHWESIRNLAKNVRLNNSINSTIAISFALKLNLIFMKFFIYILQFADKIFSGGLRVIKKIIN